MACALDIFLHFLLDVPVLLGGDTKEGAVRNAVQKLQRTLEIEVNHQYLDPKPGEVQANRWKEELC